VIFNLLTKPPDAATVPFLDVSTVHSRATSTHEPPRKFACTFFCVSLLFSIVKQRKLAVSYDVVLNKPITLSLSLFTQIISNIIFFAISKIAIQAAMLLFKIILLFFYARRTVRY